MNAALRDFTARPSMDSLAQLLLTPLQFFTSRGCRSPDERAFRHACARALNEAPIRGPRRAANPAALAARGAVRLLVDTLALPAGRLHDAPPSPPDLPADDLTELASHAAWRADALVVTEEMAANAQRAAPSGRACDAYGFFAEHARLCSAAALAPALQFILDAPHACIADTVSTSWGIMLPKRDAGFRVIAAPTTLAKLAGRIVASVIVRDAAETCREAGQLCLGTADGAAAVGVLAMLGASHAVSADVRDAFGQVATRSVLDAAVLYAPAAARAIASIVCTRRQVHFGNESRTCAGRLAQGGTASMALFALASLNALRAMRHASVAAAAYADDPVRLFPDVSRDPSIADALADANLYLKAPWALPGPRGVCAISPHALASKVEACRQACRLITTAPMQLALRGAALAAVPSLAAWHIRGLSVLDPQAADAAAHAVDDAVRDALGQLLGIPLPHPAILAASGILPLQVRVPAARLAACATIVPTLLRVLPRGDIRTALLGARLRAALNDARAAYTRLSATDEPPVPTRECALAPALIKRARAAALELLDPTHAARLRSVAGNALRSLPLTPPTDTVWRSAMRLSLGPPGPTLGFCPACRKSNISCDQATHSLTCRKLAGEITKRHSTLIATIERFARSAGFHAIETEPPRPRTDMPHGRADLAMKWMSRRGKERHLCFDVTVAAPTSVAALLGGSAKTDGIAAKLAHERKVITYADDAVTPIVFETYGRTDPKTSKALSKLCKSASIIGRASATRNRALLTATLLWDVLFGLHQFFTLWLSTAHSRYSQNSNENATLSAQNTQATSASQQSSAGAPRVSDTNVPPTQCGQLVPHAPSDLPPPGAVT